MRLRNFATMAAVCAPVALMGCSMFGAGQKEAAAPQTAPVPVAAPTPPPPAPTATAAQNEADHDLVRQVQTQLKQGHMYRGHVDGIWGRMTMHGVMQFQRAHSLQANGHLTDATLSAMNLQPAGGGATSSGENNMNAPANSNGMTEPSGNSGMNQSSGSSNMSQPSGTSNMNPPSGSTGMSQPSGSTGMSQPSGSTSGSTSQ